MQRSWIVVALIGLALLGGVLIVTADDDSGPPLDDIVTAEGLNTQIPQGWLESPEFSFDFLPTLDEQVFDKWTVARGCPTDGCAPRSLDEWWALVDELPTFVGLASTDGLFNTETETLDDARVFRAQTETGGRLVFVAAFTDGAEAYVACSLQLGLSADQRLSDAIVDVCRSTSPELVAS